MSVEPYLNTVLSVSHPNWWSACNHFIWPGNITWPHVIRYPSKKHEKIQKYSGHLDLNFIIGFQKTRSCDYTNKLAIILEHSGTSKIEPNKPKWNQATFSRSTFKTIAKVFKIFPRFSNQIELRNCFFAGILSHWSSKGQDNNR